jgi:predicted RNA-binding protein with PIN domain
MSDQTRLALGDLPEPLRARVVALVADVLPDVVRLPPPLRRVATFAPARRPKLGASAIVEALGSDDDFRERVATQVGARSAPRDLADGEAPSTDLAAVVWLTRPEGWEALVGEAVRSLREAPSAVARDDAEVERLREKLQAAEQAARDLRARHRAQLDELKSENASLRRKLGESRAAERTARADVEEAEQALAEARANDDAAMTALEKEVRRLRAQVVQLEAEVAAGRRSARSERDEVTLRARLLLDTVIDAAAGLRRELGLPAVAGAPGDRVEAAVEEASARAAAPGSSGAPSPAVLEQLLAMPRARLIIDGYNVSKTAWPTSSLEAQRIRLVNGLAPLVARTGAEATVVFDAAASTSRPVVPTPRGIKVLFSPEGVIADDVIRDLVDAEPEGRVVLVVSDDKEVRDDVTASGARAIPAAAFLSLLSGLRR